jgi:hypothetical protein
LAQSRLIRHFYGGKAGLLDWQAVRRGHPSRELAYTLITSLTPEDRRATQHDLLDDYRRALAAAGGPDRDRDDLWLGLHLRHTVKRETPEPTAGRQLRIGCALYRCRYSRTKTGICLAVFVWYSA